MHTRRAGAWNTSQTRQWDGLIHWLDGDQQHQSEQATAVGTLQLLVIIKRPFL